MRSTGDREARPRPPYDELRGRPGYPDRSSWGLWGDTDQVGAFNDVTPEDVADAARLVTDGAVFALNWDQRLPDPALYTRGTLTRTVIDHGGALDDYYDDFWPQQSSQWDGLAHIRHPRHGFYGGREAHELRGPDARNGIEHWARRGIAARFVLADVDRWRASTGRPLHPDRGEGVPATDVIATLEAQAVELRPGAVLLLRFGWITWYEQLDQPARDAVADPAGGWTASGLRADTHMLRWLWDSGVVAVAADNPAVEAVPAGPGDRSLHTDLLTLLGVALGELWYLDRLAAHCAATGRYTGLLASAPMHLAGGVGSPANALALM